jgi:hypothetical protein
MRNNHYKNYANGTSCDCRAHAVSSDGGKTFGPRSFDPVLVSLFASPADGGVGFSKARIQGE